MSHLHRCAHLTCIPAFVIAGQVTSHRFTYTDSTSYNPSLASSLSRQPDHPFPSHRTAHAANSDFCDTLRDISFYRRTAKSHQLRPPILLSNAVHLALISLSQVPCSHFTHDPNRKRTKQTILSRFHSHAPIMFFHIYFDGVHTATVKTRLNNVLLTSVAASAHRIPGSPNPYPSLLIP